MHTESVQKTIMHTESVQKIKKHIGSVQNTKTDINTKNANRICTENKKKRNALRQTLR